MLHTDAILPDLSDEYPLSEEQISAFRRDGHIHLPQVCSAEEISAYRAIISETAVANFGDVPDMEERDTFGKAFLQTLNLRYKSAGVARFLLARRFASIVARLMGEDAVRIYHEQALFKEPGGAHTPLHQDQYYWPLATDHAMGMWMPLVDVELDMGPIYFASGSQKEGFAGQLAISNDSQQELEQVVKDRGYPLWQRAIKAGDATFHTGWTIHGALPNNSDSLREAMVVTYYPDGTRVDELSNESRVGDAQTYLGGRTTGELADSEMNTLVYEHRLGSKY